MAKYQKSKVFKPGRSKERIGQKINLKRLWTRIVQE